MTSAETAFDELVERMTREPDVEHGKAFASRTLKAGGKIFAMLVKGELVVKLPADRCEELVAAHDARPFEMANRRMREWVTIERGDWPALAGEALAFGRSAQTG